MLKIDFWYLANTLITTNNKVDDFIKKMSIVFNQLFIAQREQGGA